MEYLSQDVITSEYYHILDLSFLPMYLELVSPNPQGRTSNNLYQKTVIHNLSKHRGISILKHLKIFLNFLYLLSGNIVLCYTDHLINILVRTTCPDFLILSSELVQVHPVLIHQVLLFDLRDSRSLKIPVNFKNYEFLLLKKFMTRLRKCVTS